MIKTSKLLFSGFLVSCLFLTSIADSYAARPACQANVKRLKSTAKRAESTLKRAESGLTRAYNQEFNAFLQGERQLLRPRMNEEINKMAANFFTAQCVLMIVGGNPVCKIFNPNYQSLRDPKFDEIPVPDKNKYKGSGGGIGYAAAMAQYNKLKQSQDKLRSDTQAYNRQICTSAREDCTRKVALFQGQVLALTNQRRALEKSVNRIIAQRKTAREKAEALVVKSIADFDSKQAAYETAATACDAASYIEECKVDFIKSCKRDVNSTCRSLKGMEKTTCLNNGNAKCTTDANVQCKG